VRKERDRQRDKEKRERPRDRNEQTYTDRYGQIKTDTGRQIEIIDRQRLAERDRH